MAGASHLQTALTEGPTSVSGSDIPFARDLFCLAFIVHPTATTFGI